jgi:lipoprotein-anchoring transpeptidase ErfK/SrfK
MHRRSLVLILLLGAAVVGGAAIAALVAWPQAQLRSSSEALTSISLASYGGTVTRVEVTTPAGTHVPVALRGNAVWPTGKVSSGEELTVAVTVRRPGWAAWLVGQSATRSFTVRTPSAALRGSWLQVTRGAPVTLGFDTPVSLVSLRGATPLEYEPGLRVIPTGIVAKGGSTAGSIEVAAAARSWETLPPPVRVTWFPALPVPQLLSEPRPGAPLTPESQLVLTFSRPVADVLGSLRPSLSPATPGHWRLVDAHTLAFAPSGSGFALGQQIVVSLAKPVVLAGDTAGQLTRSLAWQVPIGTTLRLQELLAQLGYLPLEWHPDGAAAPRTAREELAAALTAPAGHFSWRYPNTPASLEALWSPGESNTITQGAVMMFEHNNDLAVDGIAGPEVWATLIADIVSGNRDSAGYSYVYVHRTVPQSLNLWVNGETILSSPGNTGVPAAPTKLGTFPVFEHIPVGTMKGTNPNGTHYDDPGIRWISYFHNGEAIHTFNRASYGTPQSLGCVELPLAAAAKVWPHTPIGTLVTIEN